MDELLERVLAMGEAPEAFASYRGGTESVTRFAENQATQNTSRRVRTLSLSVTLGRRTGTATTTDVSDAGLRAVVDRAHAIAALLPEDPEYVEPLGPQAYRSIEAAVDEPLNADARAARAAEAIAAGDGLRVAGTVTSGDGFVEVMNKHGLRGSHRWTEAGFTATMRTPDGTGSSRVESLGHRRASDIDVAALARRAAERARASASPREIAPGDYTVVLEPQAAADLLSVLGGFMERRAADEGRSFFSGKLGERIVDPRVTMLTLPADPRHLGAPFDDSGLPIGDRAWIDDGALRALPTDRFWARKQGASAIPGLSSVVIPGGEGSVDDLIAGTPRGILITRFWYIRTVDAKRLLMTGLTRDGTFLIEDGKIAAPLINYRFNESPIDVLANVEAMSREEKVGGWVVPGLRVRGFTLTSPSRAV